jgi:hypothetical protein
MHDAKFFHTQSYLLDPDSRTFGVGIGHNQYKFFPAVATRNNIRPCVAKQENADFVKHGIARYMTEAIIETFEVREVAYAWRKRQYTYCEEFDYDPHDDVFLERGMCKFGP